jgi:glycerophosphoryl diester phosphodiesterase
MGISLAFIACWLFISRPSRRGFTVKTARLPQAVTRPLITGAAVAVALTSLPLAVTPATAAPAHPSHQSSAPAEEFDLQSHRGGRAEWTESSLAAFANSLEVGVTTLELDTKVTEDDVVMVWHDDTIQAEKCQDTGAAFEGDPEYPYVGDRIRDLTYDQVQTLDCGYQQLPDYPLQDVIEGNKLATLEEVFDLVRDYDAEKIRWNIETKVEDPEDVEHREVLVSEVVETIDEHGWPKRTQLQSFDWDALDQAAELDPRLELVALATAENPEGAGTTPQDVADRGYPVWSPSYDLLTEENIAEAHELGLKVVPWTVNNRVEMEQLMDWGVDGIITDYPSVLRDVMDDRGMDLPEQYEADSDDDHGRGGEKRADHGHQAPAGTGR